MQFGLLYEMQRPYDDEIDWYSLYQETLAQCELADQVGFDNLWFVEHHFLYGFSGSPCPEVMFGALSQRTKNIRIGFGVSILPNHHPVRIAERAAMVDQLTGGRVEFGTGRSNAYEQLGQGIDPRETRDRWDEAIRMIPQIWQTSGEFEWDDGGFWNVPPRRVLPQPYQKPHPKMYLACTQTESFRLAAQKGIGVLSSASYAVDVLAEHVKVYRDAIKDADPVGAEINDFWGNNVHSFCAKDDQAAKELCAESMKTFFGPDKPYIAGRINAYEELLEAWGRRAGAPEGRLRSLAAPSPMRNTRPRPPKPASRWTAVPARPARRWPSSMPTSWPTGASSSPETRRAVSRPSRPTRTSALTR